MDALRAQLESALAGRYSLERYGQITHLWARADPSLQPRVKALRERIAKLLGETG